jgi:hypothetical protein
MRCIFTAFRETLCVLAILECFASRRELLVGGVDDLVADDFCALIGGRKEPRTADEWLATFGPRRGVGRKARW